MRRLAAGVMVLGALVATPSVARADGFIAPFVGVNFGGDTTKNSTPFGGSLGFLGHTAGVELDFGYTPNFLATPPRFMWMTARSRRSWGIS